jgi:hypothetical protein
MSHYAIYLISNGTLQWLGEASSEADAFEQFDADVHVNPHDEPLEDVMERFSISQVTPSLAKLHELWGGSRFVKNVAEQCGYNISNAEIERIKASASTPEEFETIWADQGWWTDPNRQLFKFTAYNTQSMYGWGDSAEAERYCDYLNTDREINVYSVYEITDEVEIAKRDRNSEGCNLTDALQEIAADAE